MIKAKLPGSIENDFVALSESLMTSRSAETTRESAKSNDCSSGAVISNIQCKSSQVQAQENSIIDPIVEALDQIIQDSIDDDSNLQKHFSTRSQKRRCIYTHTRPPTPNPKLIVTPSSDSPILDKSEETHCVTSRGDAPKINPKKNFTPKISAFYSTNLSFSPRDTMRPLDISTDSTSSEEEEKKRNLAAATYCITPNSNPNLKTVPRRKLSVFHRSFDVESLQASRDEKEDFREKKRSVSTPDQEEDHERKENQTPITRTSLLNSYRSVLNSTDSSDSTSPDKNLGQDEDVLNLATKKPNSRPVVLAPTKLIFHQKVEEEVRRFDETRVISKDLVLEKGAGKETDPNVFDNVTIRKKFGSGSEKDMNSKKEKEEKKDLKSSGDATFTKVTVRKGFTTPISPVLFNFVEKIDETIIISDNSSMCVTNEEMKADFKDNIAGVPEVKVCSAIGDNSGAVETGNEKASKITPSVVTAMSSAEDSSDSECDRINSKDDRQVAVSVPANLIQSLEPFSQLKIPPEDGKPEGAEESEIEIRDQKIRPHKRSSSESESIGCRPKECQCKNNEVISTPLQALDKNEIHPKAFPSLSDDHLQESGISNFSDLQSEFSENLSEDDLERKFTALSVGLRTDRMTLSRRLTLSQRQRDLAERNMATEVEKMQQDIQDLAPLCTDRESLERVERVRQQLDMIAQCAHRVSCVAETLGAVHQERRVSRAALLADRYLQLLRTRCEKLTAEVNETKRILMENNIVIEEHPSELGDDIPRIRYRAVLTNNRTMMARRRASIAAISRPLGSQQDLKEGPRQRNSVSGRVTFRRPSLSYEAQKLENDKLVRTDSSSSIGELREIFEQAESRRNSREENNNVVRSPANYVISATCETIEGEIWSHPEEDFSEELLAIENVSSELVQQRQSISSSFWTTIKTVMFHPIFWYMLISFCFGFYMKHVFSSKLCAGAPYKWASFEEFFEPYIQIKDTAPRPI